MLKFYTLKEKEPIDEKEILIKWKRKRIDDLPSYYIVAPYTYIDEENNTKHWKFEEAGGEQYTYWDEEDVIGWCSVREIERNEEWN